MKRIIFLLILLFTVTGCSKAPMELSGFSMDSSYLVKADTLSVDKQDQIRKYLNHIDGVFNAYRNDSILSRLNQQKKLIVSSDDSDATELYSVIAKSLPFCDDYFDISIRPVSKLWDFKTDYPSLPDDSDITFALQSVSPQNIILEDELIYLENDAEIELGAVVKGYVCDEVADMLAGSRALIDMGGTVKTVGKDSVVGIKVPFGDGVLCSFTLPEGMAVATSGSYERNFSVDGEFYHHILNPKTGYPFDSDFISVSVICDSAMEADILATINFAKGLTHIPTKNETVIFVTKDRKIFISGEIENFKLLHNEYTLMN